MGNDRREDRSRRRIVPGLLAAALTLSAVVAVAVPSWAPPTSPPVTTAAAGSVSPGAGPTGAGSAPSPAGPVPAADAAPAPTAPGPTTPDADGPDPAPDGPGAPGPSVVPVPHPATGALFDGPAEDPGDHFCSGSVVDSAAGDLVVTAAHCVADGDGTPPRTGMSFAPGYDDGTAPFGYWTVTAAAVPPEWTAAGDPDSDIAFLTVSRPDSPPIQQVTGAYRLAVGASQTGPTPVTAIGYNDGDPGATTVSGTAGALDDDQWQLDRPGLDQGASGGPWLTGPDGSEILAVTGGYQQGGDSPDVSYGADLGPAAQSAYRSAGGTD